MKAVFSIKPYYCESIFLGTKRYEYRKVLCKEQIDCIVIYETHPVSAVTGEVLVDRILVDTPKEIWKYTKDFSGITENDFFSYYYGYKIAVAYCLKEPKKYSRELSLNELGLTSIPQSFAYLAYEE